METPNDILVFKTNIKTKPDQVRLKKILDTYPAIEQWNVDTKDVDCVLRVVSRDVSPQEIIQLVTRTGYQCCELE